MTFARGSDQGAGPMGCQQSGKSEDPREITIEVVLSNEMVSLSGPVRASIRWAPPGPRGQCKTMHAVSFPKGVTVEGGVRWGDIADMIAAKLKVSLTLSAQTAVNGDPARPNSIDPGRSLAVAVLKRPRRCRLPT